MPRFHRRSSHPSRVLFAALVLALGSGVATAQDTPMVRVIAVDGVPAVTPPDGQDQMLDTGDVIAVGSRVWNTPGSRVALEFVSGADGDPETSDVLILAPNAAVVVRAFAPEDGGAERFIVEIEQGVVRVMTRAPEDKSRLALRTRDHEVRLGGVHAVISMPLESELTSYQVFEGALVVHVGPRRIKVIDGMSRSVEGDRVKGAQRMSKGQRTLSIETTSILGLDVKRPRPEPRPRPAVAATQPVEAAPEMDGVVQPVLETTPANEDELLPPGSKPIYVQFDTSLGSFIIELNHEKAPVTVDNFSTYVDDGFYDDTIFHRIVKSGIQVIQGGGFTANLKIKVTRDSIENEWQNGLKNLRGTISMARTGEPDSATSQFFINTGDNPVLDQARQNTGFAGYAVFGRVVRGMEVVDRIASVETRQLNRQFASIPVQTVEIRRAMVVDRNAALRQ